MRRFSARIRARVALPVDAARVRLYALDEAGNRRTAIPVAERGGRALLAIGPQYTTVWYEIEIVPQP